jgi:hypothetical protein
VGGPSTGGEYLQAFTEHAQADELVLAHAAPLVEERLRSLELVAEVAGLVTPAAP